MKYQKITTIKESGSKLSFKSKKLQANTTIIKSILTKEKISKLPDFAFHGSKPENIEKMVNGNRQYVSGHFFVVLEEDRNLSPERFIEKFEGCIKISLGHSGYEYRFDEITNEYIFSKRPAILIYLPKEIPLVIDNPHQRTEVKFGCTEYIFRDCGKLIPIYFDNNNQNELNKKWKEHVKGKTVVGPTAALFLYENMAEIMIKKLVDNLE